jgi:hypothetical protein
VFQPPSQKPFQNVIWREESAIAVVHWRAIRPSSPVAKVGGFSVDEVLFCVLSFVFLLCLR